MHISTSAAHDTQYQRTMCNISLIWHDMPISFSRSYVLNIFGPWAGGVGAKRVSPDAAPTTEKTNTKKRKKEAKIINHVGGALHMKAVAPTAADSCTTVITGKMSKAERKRVKKCNAKLQAVAAGAVH